MHGGAAHPAAKLAARVEAAAKTARIEATAAVHGCHASASQNTGFWRQKERVAVSSGRTVCQDGLKMHFERIFGFNIFGVF